MAKQRTCLLCGKQYEYCPHCGKHNPTETWRFLYCSENCNQIDNIISAYKANKISASEAKSRLSILSVPPLSAITNYVRPLLEQIYATVDVEVASYSEDKEESEEKSQQLKIIKKKRKIVNEN